MANIGSDTKLIKDGNVIAGVRIISVDWKSESVDIGEGESDGYRLLAEIDGLTTIDIQCEGITKDHELQEIAYSRSQSRLLENVTLDLPQPDGETTTVTLNLYIDSLSVNATYNDAISFSASFTASAIIENGEIVNVNRNSVTGQITGTPGYDFHRTITCVSNYFDDTHWEGTLDGLQASWTGSYWEPSGVLGLISLEKTGSWSSGYRPSKVFIAALSSQAGTATFSMTGFGGNIIVPETSISLSSNPISFEFNCDFSHGSDINILTLQLDNIVPGLQLTCIEFE